MDTSHQADFYAWAFEQAALLRAGNLPELDVDNVAQEIEDMARHEKRELRHRLLQLEKHLLKWKCQPARRCHSWLNTIEDQRFQIATELRAMPSLRRELEDPAMMNQIWFLAVRKAARETRQAELPSTPLWTLDQVLDPDLLPD